MVGGCDALVMLKYFLCMNYDSRSVEDVRCACMLRAAYGCVYIAGMQNSIGPWPAAITSSPGEHSFCDCLRSFRFRIIYRR